MGPPLDLPVRWPFDSFSGSPSRRIGKSNGRPRSIAGNVSRDRHCLVISGWRFNGDNDLNDGPGIRVPESQLPAEFLDALPHPADADADAVGPELGNMI